MKPVNRLGRTRPTTANQNNITIIIGLNSERCDSYTSNQVISITSDNLYYVILRWFCYLFVFKPLTSNHHRKQSVALLRSCYGLMPDATEVIKVTANLVWITLFLKLM